SPATCAVIRSALAYPGRPAPAPQPAACRSGVRYPEHGMLGPRGLHGPPWLEAPGDEAPCCEARVERGTVAANPTRRVVLAAAALLPLAAASGCGSVDVLATPPSEGPAVRLLRSAIAAEQTMIAHYGTVLRGAHGGGADLTAELEPLLAEHRAHLAQLQSRLVIAPASLAQLFASISASEATHVPVLDVVASRAGRAG